MNGECRQRTSRQEGLPKMGQPGAWPFVQRQLPDPERNCRVVERQQGTKKIEQLEGLRKEFLGVNEMIKPLRKTRVN